MDASPLELAKLEAERAATLAAFRDPRRSPYASVARRDFAGTRPLELGSAEDCDVQLPGLLPHHARVAVEGDRFRIEALDDGATIMVAGDANPPTRGAIAAAGAKVELGRYTLRLSHQNFPSLLVFDAESPRVREAPPPQWFPPDPAFRVVARLVRDAEPREEVILSTRGNRRRALRLGHFELTLGGKKARLAAQRLLEPGVGEAAVSIFFRDQTTGAETYPIGRYLDPEPMAGQADAYVLDFNRAYNPACAYSPHYNCPIPPRENVLPVAVRAGEMDPGGH